MKLKSAYRKIVPNGVRRAAAVSLRGKWMPPNRLRDALAYDGPFATDIEGVNVQLLHTGRWIENDLFWSGSAGYEPVSLKVWAYLARQSQVIFDVGANTGLFAVLAKLANPAASVVAFEPLEMFAKTLRANCSLNGASVRVEQTAVSNKVERATFFVPREYAGNVYSSSLSETHYLKHQSFEPVKVDVDVTTLNVFCTERGSAPPGLLKIDAEGHDAQVVEGMGPLTQARPTMLIEVQTNETARRIASILDPLEYVYLNIDEHAGLTLLQGLVERSTSLNCVACRREVADDLLRAVSPGMTSR